MTDAERLNELILLESYARQALYEFQASPNNERWRLYTAAAIRRDRLEKAIVLAILSMDWSDE